MSRGKILHHTYEMLKSLWSQPDANWEANSEFIKKLNKLKAANTPQIETTPKSPLSDKGEIMQIIKNALGYSSIDIRHGTTEEWQCLELIGRCEDIVEQVRKLDRTKVFPAIADSESERFRKLQDECAIMERHYWERINELEEQLATAARSNDDLRGDNQVHFLKINELQKEVSNLQSRLHDMDTRFAVAFEALEVYAEIASGSDISKLARETLAQLREKEAD